MKNSGKDDLEIENFTRDMREGEDFLYAMFNQVTFFVNHCALAVYWTILYLSKG
jgi:hypothetical protein